MRWMCSRQAGGEGHLHVRRALMALIELFRWLVASSVLVRLSRRPCGACFRVLSHCQRGGFTRFHALRYGPKPTLGVASGPTGYARLCGARWAHRDGRGGLFGHLLEHEVLQPPSWATGPYGTLLAAQRLMTVGDVNRCGCSSCTARYGAALKRRPLTWMSRSTQTALLLKTRHGAWAAGPKAQQLCEPEG